MLFIFVGCTKEATHFPSIFELPGAIITSVIDNGLYGHKRKKVKGYVIKHYDVLKKEVTHGGISHILELMQISGVEEKDYFKVQQALHEDSHTMFKNIILSSDAVMNAFSSLYPSKEKTKTINGFTYTQASNMVKKYLNRHFNTFRLSLKDRDGSRLMPLAKKLKIKDSKKQEQFYEKLYDRYDALIIEPVVVGFMMHGL